MAQTGLTTAVGLCIENVWRTVPLTVVAGAVNTPGIVATNPNRFMVVEPGQGMRSVPQVEHPDNEIDGDIQLSRTLLVAKNYGGEYQFKPDGENIYYPLLGMFGRDIQTLAQAADSTHTPAAYKHVFLPGKYAPSFTIEEQIGDHNYGRLSAGTLLERLEMDFGRVIMARMKLIGHRGLPNTYPNATGLPTDYTFGATASVLPSQMGGDGTKQIQRTATPGYVDVEQGRNGTGPFVFAGMQFGSETGFASAFITIDDVPQANAQILEGFNLSFERKIDSQMVAGSSYDAGAVTGSQFMVAGKLNVLFQDSTFQQAALRHSKIGLNFKIVGVPIGTSGQLYTIEVYLPHAKFTENQVEIPDGPVVAGGSFVARRDPALGYAAKVTIINTFDNSTLAGAAGTTGAALGLGGWSNS